MFHTLVLPALFALFVWWLSTGLILYLDGLPQRTFRWSMLGATLLFGLSLWGLERSSGDVSVRGAYIAFSCGLLAWGWQEISFYMGYVTGPRRAPCEEGCRGWRHFGHAIQTSLWHELAIIAAGSAVVALTWHGDNQVGTWTFMVLWWMHQSAKLNVFLGVRNLNEEFLPEHLQFLRSFLTKKSMNLLFPISITVSMVIMVRLVQAATAPSASAFQAAGFSFLSAMMGLAILEHWLLMLPLPAAALWGWSLKSRKPVAAFAVEVVAGFLGAGKTTYLRQIMSAGDNTGTVVLVNDFAAVGIDGSLLRERGSEVIELPNGCICCSLKQDLAAQLTGVLERFSPKRVLIEPSGVADLASLLAVLSQPALLPAIGARAVTTVLDAGAFLRDYARLGAPLEAQLRLADRVVINKTDLAPPATLELIETTIRTFNPAAEILHATYGIAAPAPRRAAPASPVLPQEQDHAPHDHRPHTHDHHAHHHDAPHHDTHEPAHHHHDDAFGFDSWSGALHGACRPARLHDLLDAVRSGRFGQIERLKGIARAEGGGWIRFDVAGGRASLAAFAPPGDEQPRVVAIGTRLQEARLQAAFDACSTQPEEAAA